MAVGDFGAVIEQRQYFWNPDGINWEWVLEHPNGNNIFIATRIYNGLIEIATWQCDPVTGDISNAPIAYQTVVTSWSTELGKLFHINGNIFGMFYRRYHVAAPVYCDNYVMTFTIGVNGGWGGIIYNTSLEYCAAFNANNFCNMVRKPGTNIYCTAHGRTPGFCTTFRSFNIPATGTPVTKVDENTGASEGGANVPERWVGYVGGDCFAVFIMYNSGAMRIRTYSVSDAGVVAYIGTKAIEASPGIASNRLFRAKEIASNIWAMAYAINADTRIRTTTIWNDGTFGSNIDFDDTFFASEHHVFEFFELYPGTGIYIIAACDVGGVNGRCISFRIGNTGLIGAFLDAMAAVPNGGVRLAPASDSIFTGLNTTGGFDGWCRSWGFSPPVLPTVTTQAATAITAHTATGNGNITDTGGADCDRRGIVYGLTSLPNPGNVAPPGGYDDHEEEVGTFGAGAFTRNLTGLVRATTYYARAYAHNYKGYTYGNEITFTTLAELPTAQTDPATDIT